MGMFEWDEKKQRANIAKHGVDFLQAQEAFLDLRRVIAVDEGHSEQERRLFCIGRANDGAIITVRFTRRGNRIRIVGAGYWRKGRKLYEKTNG